jgi:hypothetical protein
MKVASLLLAAAFALALPTRADEAGLKKAAASKHAHDQAAAAEEKKLAADQKKAKEAAAKKKKDGTGDAPATGEGGVSNLR